MIIDYTVGNGYYCCCRQSSSYQEEFFGWQFGNTEKEFIEGVIDWCVDKAHWSEWDFDINDITDWDGNSEEFKALVERAIEKRQQQIERERLIKSTQESVASHQKWLDTMEDTRLFHLTKLAEYQQKLAELIKT